MSDKSLSHLSHATLQEIAQKFQLDPQTFVELEGYESIVFSAGSSVIKAYDNSLRTKDELLAELTFINHLATQGINVANALASLNGALIEDISDHFVVKFVKVNGTSPSATEANTELYALMGKTLGKMHAATKTYKPQKNQKRNEWFEDEHIKNWERNLANNDPVKAKIKKQIHDLLAFETDKDAYGLIHADFHSDNFLVGNETLTVIDFADCLYGWFAMDIATAMFYFKRFLASADNASEAQQKEFAASFYHHFIKAYLKENSLSKEWLECIPVFLLWRYIDLYLYINQLRQSTELDEDEQAAFNEFKDIILNNEIIELDWVNLAL